jgi:iron(III) transport system permease protein
MGAIRDVAPLARPAVLPGIANLAGRIVAALVPSVLTACLLVAAVLPIGALLVRSLFDRAGSFVGARNFVRYATEPGLSIAAWNSVALSTLATVIVICIAFPVAYALARSRIPLRGLLRVVVMLPLLTPSLLPAFGLVYLFGNQGLLKSWLFGAPLYGPVGIVMGSVFYALPHAVLILSAGLAAGDARLYEAAQALKAGPWRTFRTVTLPSCRYALVSAASVVFVLVFTDFGIPTVLGGSTNVLATDIYKLVIGRFDFELGAVVGVLLLLPAVIAYGIDALVRRTERMHITGRSVPIEPRPSLHRDGPLLVFAILVAGAILGLIGTAVFGSLVRFWPYNLILGLHNYGRLLEDPDEVRAVVNSLVLAACVATLGTVMVACTGWVVARRIGPAPVHQTMHALAMVPVAVPGLVLGLGYVFFFNNPHNPLHGLQGTMALIVICTVTHFYTVPHLMTVGSLSRLDREIDLAGQALRSGPLGTARRIHVSFLAPTLVDVAGYFFVNAMTTVSALIFLFTAKTRVAAIAVVNMVEGSRFGQAAALAVLIMVMSIVATLVQIMVRAAILRAQGWRRRGTI